MLVKDITNQKYVKELLKDANATNKNVYFNPYNNKAIRVIYVIANFAHLINGTKIDLTDKNISGLDFYIN